MRYDGGTDSTWSRFAKKVVKRNPLTHVLLKGGSWSGHERNHLFINKDGQQFEELSLLSGLDDPADSRVCVVWDYDRDGWQDFAVVNSNNPQLRLFRNQIGQLAGSAEGNMFAVQFVGASNSAVSSVGRSNRNGYGSRVTIALGDAVLTREHICGQGYAAQNSATMLIGIGSHPQADRLQVRFPSGTVQTMAYVPARSLVTVYEDPSQSPTGEAFVVAAYGPARQSEPTVIAQGSGDTVPALALRAGAQESAKLRLYTTMATWCVSCAQKLPAAKQLESHFQAGELAMYGIPVDESDTREKLANWASRMRPAYALLTDLTPGETTHVKEIVKHNLKADILPATILTDSQGRVLHVQGGLPSISKIRELMRPAPAGDLPSH